MAPHDEFIMRIARILNFQLTFRIKCVMMVTERMFYPAAVHPTAVRRYEDWCTRRIAMATPKLVNYAIATARTLVSDGDELPPSLFFRDGHERQFILRRVSLESPDGVQEMPRLIADAVAEGVATTEFTLIVVAHDQARIVYQRTFGRPARVWQGRVHRHNASVWLGDFDEKGVE
jgi:hypothetical protein